MKKPAKSETDVAIDNFIGQPISTSLAALDKATGCGRHITYNDWLENGWISREATTITRYEYKITAEGSNYLYETESGCVALKE